MRHFVSFHTMLLKAKVSFFGLPKSCNPALDFNPETKASPFHRTRPEGRLGCRGGAPACNQPHMKKPSTTICACFRKIPTPGTEKSVLCG